MDLSKPYKSPFLLRNRHLATIWPALFRNVEVSWTRERISTPDGDFFDVDTLAGTTDRALIIMHGLEGSTDSNYVKGLARHFNANGFHIFAMNFRSCSGVPNNKLTSYHSGFTADTRQLVERLCADPRFSHVYLAGFSLGGNALLKFLAEEGSNMHPKVKAAAAVSVPVDLKGSAGVLASASNRIYMNRFLSSLKNKIRIKDQLFPGTLDLKDIDLIRDFKEFDDRFTAPIHGFKDAEEYWGACSSLFVLDDIHVPTLLLSAYNDPFLSRSCFPAAYTEGDKPLHAEFIPLGGHVGFASGNGCYWSDERMMDFFREIA